MSKFIISILICSFIQSQCLGDVNEDYTIDVNDVILMVNHLLFNFEIDYYNADTNNDDNIDLLDIVNTINKILSDNNSCADPIDIIYHIHDSLPTDWITDFYFIMNNLSLIIPANQNYFNELNVYAWNSNVEDPFLGIDGGTYIGGATNGFNMVLEINEMEFEWNHMHRYSVIAHEYFHVYQLSINQPMNEPNGFDNPNTFNIKWLIEGSATTFESIYINEYYNYNYFVNDLSHINLSDSIHSNPSIFEDYISNNLDVNYVSSVFMVLVLSKELIDLGHSEEEAFRMIFKDFMLTGANNSNWENFFISVFGFSVDNFYNSLQSYLLDLENIIPNESLSLNQIFE